MNLVLSLVCLYVYTFGYCQCYYGLYELDHHKNFVCDPYRLGWVYSGYRIQLQFIRRMWRSNAINHIHTRISYCEGSVSTGMDSYAPVTKTATSMVDSKREFELLAWGRKICSNQLSRNTCMMLARRSEVFEMLVSNNSSYNSPYLFGNFVGGLYQCPGSSIDDGIECNKTNARPIAPLIADVVKYEWVEIIGTGRFKVIRKLILSTYDFGASFGKGPLARLYKIMYQSKRPPLNWPDLIDNRDFQTLNYDYYDDVWNQGTEL